MGHIRVDEEYRKLAIKKKRRLRWKLAIGAMLIVQIVCMAGGVSVFMSEPGEELAMCVLMTFVVGAFAYTIPSGEM